MIAWEITAPSLLLLIKRFRGSKEIRFDFGSDESRKIFVQQIKKIEIAEAEKRKFIAELKVKKEKWVEFKNELEKKYEQYSDNLHALLDGDVKLYPHQIVASMFMNTTRSTLISHEMGLGKTLSAILYVEMNGFEKVVVITPNSLKFNFYEEVLKFTNSRAYIVNWRKNTCTIEDAKYVIVNYDFFNASIKSKRFDPKWQKLDIGRIDVVICDECQRLKNTKSNTYKNFKRTFNKKIFKGDKISKIFLSGTPAPNRAHELYTVLNQVSPTDFATKKHFQKYYCGMEYDVDSGWGYKTTGEQRLEELFHKAAPYTHRKRKKDALKDLPEKMYQKVMLEMDDSEYVTYDEIENNIANEFVERPSANHLTIMIRLRQYTAHLKVKPLLELIENILETGEKVVIVDYYKESLYELKEMLDNDKSIKKRGEIAALHTGDEKDLEVRAGIVKRFQDPDSDLKVFLGSVSTCNYGLTLTAASKLFIITLPYSVGEYDQVADRLHRIGQKNPVNIYPLVFRDTIDDYVFSAIEGKRKEIVKVMDNEEYKSAVAESVFSEVVNKIKEKHGKGI